MTEHRMMEIWGDGSEFGLSPQDELSMNAAFCEVAMKFAAKVMEIEHKEAYNDGWIDGVNSERYGMFQ